MKKIKYSIMMAVAVVLGFSSCGNEDEVASGEEKAPKNVTVHISTPSTYGEEATAVGQTPVLNDVAVFFVGGGVVKAKGTMTSAEVTGSGKTFASVPGSATDVVIIANATALSSPNAASVAVNDPATKLDALMFEQSVQTHPASAVNVYGKASITGAAGSEAAAVTLAPAISRIEIAQVKAKTGAAIALTSFKLAGIYINNTYTKCGTDYSTLPVAPTDILNYGPVAAVWTNGSYPARFKDEWTSPTAGTSFAPTVGTNKWSYYVMPVVASKGTTINGAVQTSVPHIVLKITDATASGYTFPNPAYVTIKDIQVGGTSLTALQRGKVYSISTIELGGENLAGAPTAPATQNVAVTATLTPWTNEPVTPVIP